MRFEVQQALAGIPTRGAREMRNLESELNAARALHRWLRNAALTAIPVFGLAGCGSDCDRSDFSVAQQFDGGWAVGSEHSAADCAQYCGVGRSDICSGTVVTGCSVQSAATVSCNNHYTYCADTPCGRLPAGLRSRPGDRVQCSPVAAYLARAARLEGAAVFAFRALERELVAHGAPESLVSRAKQAQGDETRHHAAMAGLAGRFGASVLPVQVEEVPIRSLVEIAVENAVEGCVRETWGAAVAAYQGEAARDRSVRRAMRSIAVDEAEHALLGWNVDAWARRRLSRADGAKVDAALAASRDHLLQGANAVAPVLRDLCGLPDAAASSRLLAALGTLWS